MTINEPGAHVHARIAEQVSRELGMDVSAADVYDILDPEKVTFANGFVKAAVEREAREYGIAP